MTLPMNERDLIDLNAYLDGELTDRERAAFEIRLAQDAALQEELRALRATVAILGMAEPIRAPRNFTLDPAVYGKLGKGSFWDRLGTPLKVMLPAGAAILATLVCAGIVILSSGGRGFGAAPMVAEEPAAEMQMAAEEPAAAMDMAAEESGAERMADQPAEAELLAESAAEDGAANAAGETAAEGIEAAAEPGGGGAPPEDGAAFEADVAGADNAEPDALEAPAAAPMEEEAAEEVVPDQAIPSDDQQFVAPTTKEPAVGQVEVEAQAQPATGEPAAQTPPRLLATGVVVGLIAGALVILLLAGLTLILSRRRR